MSAENRRLAGRFLLIGAIVLGVLAALCWTGVLPIDHGARRVMTLAFAIAALGDALIGMFLLARSQS
jgi:hypothetical protein